MATCAVEGAHAERRRETGEKVRQVRRYVSLDAALFRLVSYCRNNRVVSLRRCGQVTVHKKNRVEAAIASTRIEVRLKRSYLKPNLFPLYKYATKMLFI